MGQSVFRANLCAGKICIDSSIQARGAGEVMSQNWRIYCLFDKRNTHLLYRLNKPHKPISGNAEKVLREKITIYSEKYQ
jgi:hypothetical protein